MPTDNKKDTTPAAGRTENAEPAKILLWDFEVGMPWSSTAMPAKICVFFCKQKLEGRDNSTNLPTQRNAQINFEEHIQIHSTLLLICIGEFSSIWIRELNYWKTM